MYQLDQQILILADLPKSFRLHDLFASGQTDGFINVNANKYEDYELVEVIVDGLAFTLSLHQPEKAQSKLFGKPVEYVFCGPHEQNLHAIGIALGKNVAGGKHLRAINESILHVAVKIGKQVNAVCVMWCPANLQVEFDFFADSVTQYVETGTFPVLTQIAIITRGNGDIETRGLGYFAHPEIRMQVSPNHSQKEAINKLVRLIEKATRNDKRLQSSSDLEKSDDVVFFSPEENQAALGAASRTF